VQPSTRHAPAIVDEAPSTDISDSHLLLQAQTGGAAAADAFDTLYRRHLAAVYRFHMAWCGDAQQAQDLTAQTFLGALRDIRRCDARAPFTAWLFGIARHKAQDARRVYAHGQPHDRAG
jgi:DNA-directed RNA polymerase specialized sigma24 family protein